MTGEVAADPALADSLLAAQLFVANPQGFGGISLRGYGPVRDQLLAQMFGILEAQGPLVKIPVNARSEQLLGGLDLTETLAAGRAVHRAGLLERARGGVVVVPMAERVAPDIAAHLAQAIDHGELAVVLLDDGIEADETAPAALLERAAFHCDLRPVRSLDFGWSAASEAAEPARPLLKEQRKALAATAALLGIHSIRPVLFAERCARLLAGVRAGSQKADRVDNAELEAAIRLVFAPRAVQLPELQPPSGPPPEASRNTQEPEDNTDPSDTERQQEEIPLEDLLLAAAAAAIPDHILDGIDHGFTRPGGGAAGQSGNRQKSSRRGRPLGARPGIPGEGRKLALIDTLRAAAPWQTSRQAAWQAGQQAEAPDDGATKQSLHIRKSDLRIRHFEQRQESLTIFAVDASGSSAMARLAEAKGAVELMLAQAHVKRSQVALIAFRHLGAEVLLPPTRSLTRARRALGALPGGGGTPLAAGLLEARVMADASIKRGQTPMIALLTDGKANVTLAGEPDRTRAMAEAEDAAKGIAAAGHHAVVIDISARPREEAAALAAVLRGKYLALPFAGSAAMVEAIDSVAKGAPR